MAAKKRKKRRSKKTAWKKHMGSDVRMISSPTQYGHVVGSDPDGSIMVQWSGTKVVTGVSPSNLRIVPPGHAGRRRK
jgi:hypothetical protein